MVRGALVAAALLTSASSHALARPPEIADIFSLREIGGYRSGLSLSPDGTQVAVFERETVLAENDYRFHLIVAPVEGGLARSIADAGAAILRTSTGRFNGAIDDRIPFWSPDGRWVGYLANHSGSGELWRVRPDGSHNERLIADGRDVLAAAFLNDREIVFSSARPRADLAAEAERQALFGFPVDERFEPYYSLRPYPDLRVGQVVRVLSLGDGRLREATEMESRALRPQSLNDAPPDHTAYDIEGDIRAWIAPRTAGDRATRPVLGLYLVGREGEPQLCALAECAGRLTGAWIVSPSQIVFQRLEGPAQADAALYIWDAAANTARTLRRGDELLLDCEDGDQALICLYESAAAPRRLVAVSLLNGEIDILRDPNPQWADLDITRIERIEADDAYGNEGYAHLVWPVRYQPGERYPIVIVQYRSRGFLRGGVGGEYPIHALAARGYFVLSVERTEWSELEAQLPPSELQTRTELDGSELRMKQTQLEALIAALDRRGLIDSDRIGITGFSDGAETAYWMLTNTRLIAAAVVSTPPTDPIAWPLVSESFRSQQRAEGVSGPWPDAPEPWASWWRANATSLHADRIRAPILMNLSDNEVLLAFPLTTRLAELQRPYDMYVYPGEYHVKWRPQHMLSAQQRALDWLDFWLRDIEREDPAEPERLERWRRLRNLQAALAP